MWITQYLLHCYISGIISRLDYLVDLGVGAIWLSPIYKSPMADFGYDISDHRDIDPLFGKMDDFDELLKQAHEKGRDAKALFTRCDSDADLFTPTNIYSHFLVTSISVWVSDSALKSVSVNTSLEHKLLTPSMIHMKIKHREILISSNKRDLSNLLVIVKKG